MLVEEKNGNTTVENMSDEIAPGHELSHSLPTTDVYGDMPKPIEDISDILSNYYSFKIDFFVKHTSTKQQSSTWITPH